MALNRPGAVLRYSNRGHIYPVAFESPPSKSRLCIHCALSSLIQTLNQHMAKHKSWPQEQLKGLTMQQSSSSQLNWCRFQHQLASQKTSSTSARAALSATPCKNISSILTKVLPLITYHLFSFLSIIQWQVNSFSSRLKPPVICKALF